MTYQTNKTADTVKIGEEFGKNLKPGDGVLFTGEMGVGKTYFTKGIAKALSIDDEITSPTFSLVNEYYGKYLLFHFDLFRINDFNDLYSIGFFDYLDRQGIMVIEWSENLPEIENEFRRVFKININKISETKREITINDSYRN